LGVLKFKIIITEDNRARHRIRIEKQLHKKISKEEKARLGDGLFPNDMLALIISFIYVFLVIGLGTALSRRSKAGKSDISRKIVHIGAGNAIFFWPLYEHAWVVSVVPWVLAIFVLLLTPKSRVKAFRDMFQSMARDADRKKGHIIGPLLYIISIGLLVSAFGYGPYYPYFVFGAIGIEIMIWGDGFACLIGKRYGNSSKYEVFGCSRSVVGSFALLVFGFAAAMVTMLYFNSIVPLIQPSLALPVALTLPIMLETALIAAVVAMILEAITPFGIDNLTVPLLTTLVVLIIMLQLGLVAPVAWQWFVH
jgi:phytol kinase